MDIAEGELKRIAHITRQTPGFYRESSEPTTLLAHQIIFANATPESPALYLTVLGEPALKMLRYQQQYSFFDVAKLNKSIRFVNLTDVVLERDLGGMLEEITKEVHASNPSMVVDSFRSMTRNVSGQGSEMELQAFVQRLACF